MAMTNTLTKFWRKYDNKFTSQIREREKERESLSVLEKVLKWMPGAVAHTCNPSTLRGGGGQIKRSEVRDQSGKNSETPSLLKIQKVRWCVTVIPAIWEPEAGESREPRRQRLQ